MIRSAVTLSLVPEARGGPFVFWDDLPAAAQRAKELGFDALEIFPPSAEALAHGTVHRVLSNHGLSLAAVGTGAGWAKHRLRLTDPEPAVRERARDFVRGIIEAGAALGAPAIIGSMQGHWGAGAARDQALDWLAEALEELGDFARRHGQPLLYEPLNRYETNLLSRLDDAAGFLRERGLGPVRLLADFFHMNIEEADLAQALRAAGPLLGHVHFADTNRRAVGLGHLDPRPIAAALQDLQYDGYLSAEVLPWPDNDGAAAQTLRAFNEWFRSTPTA